MTGKVAEDCYMRDELTPADRARVLECLLVFGNGFMDEAAVPVCASADGSPETVQAAVSALVGEGILTREVLPTGTTRYNWAKRPKTKASEDVAVRQRMAKWFIGYLQELRPKLSDADQGIWLDQIELDHEHIHGSIEWGLKNNADPNIPLELCIACFRYWYVRGHFKSGSELTLRTVNLVPMRQDRNKLRALNNIALLLEAMGDLPRSRNALESALSLARALGDKAAEGAILVNLATNARDLMDSPGAVAYHEASITLLRNLGEKVKLIPALLNYAGTKLDFKDSFDVATLLDEAEALAREVGDGWAIAFITENRAHLAELTVNYDAARNYYQESLSRFSELKEGKGVARILKSLAELAVKVSLYDRAATLFGAAELVRESCNVQVPPIESERAIVAMTDTRGALGEAAFKRAYGMGHMMRLDEAVRYAVANG